MCVHMDWHTHTYVPTHVCATTFSLYAFAVCKALLEFDERSAWLSEAAEDEGPRASELGLERVEALGGLGFRD